MPSNSSPHLTKRKPINKTFKARSQVQLIYSSKHHVTENFFAFLRNVAHPQYPRPTNPLISFLNLAQSRRETSLGNIPSIENMISEQFIEGEDQIESISSIQRGFSDEIVSEQNYELRVLYVCLLEKIMKHLQYNTSESQRKKIVRGTWNILMKYWKDQNYFIFTNIGTKIEWGLLELINFNFRFTNKEKYHAELVLNSNKDREDIVSLKFM